MEKKLNIAVLMGGPSPEHEVSLKTGGVGLKNLDKKKYNITPVKITKKEIWVFPEKKLPTQKALTYFKELKLDIAFIAMHGAYGEDGVIQNLLENTGIPYTGSNARASALAMDKVATQTLLTAHGIRIPRFMHFSAADWRKREKNILKSIHVRFTPPLVIKPSNAGSSVGVTIVSDRRGVSNAIKKAFRFGSVALIEKYISGDEVTCGVIDGGAGSKPRALPPTQIIPKASHFFDYEAKYKPGASREITPPKMPGKIIHAIQETAVTIHKIISCSGMSRTDMIVEKNPNSKFQIPKIYVLETNTIPGMTETSLLPQEAKAAGIPFPKLLDRLIKAGLKGGKGIT